MSYKEKSKFVIFGSPRTGSQLLCHFLNNQNKIICLPEIFNSKNINFKYFNNKFEILKNNNFEIYLKLIFTKRLIKKNMSEKQAIGYKIFLGQIQSIPDPKSYLNFLKNDNTKIIFLTRNNIFLKYISKITADSINNYGCSTKNFSSLIYKLNPVKINYEDYIKYKKEVISNIETQLEYIHFYEFPFIHIKYEEFTGEKYLESYKNIFNFLNLDFNEFNDIRINSILTGKFKKINVYKLKDKIINFDILRRDAELHNDVELLSILENE
jgi:hypothetical protein